MDFKSQATQAPVVSDVEGPVDGKARDPSPAHDDT